MKICSILLVLLMFCFSPVVYGQKKKGAASSSGSSTEVTKKRDAFSGKSKKGPNIETDGVAGNSSSKVKQYKHSVSKKNVKRKDMKKQAEFSSKKSRYNTGANNKKGSASDRKTRSGRKAKKLNEK